MLAKLLYLFYGRQHLTPAHSYDDSNSRRRRVPPAH